MSCKEKSVLTKSERESLSFSTMALMMVIGGAWMVVGQSVGDVDVKPDWRRLGLPDCCHQNEFSQSRPAPPRLNSLILDARQPISDRVIGYL